MTIEKGNKPRLALRLPLFAEWHTDRYIVRHDALTESISANGALLRVFSTNPPTQNLVLRNPENGQQTEARVLAMEPAPDGASFMLRLEFPQPVFESNWQVPEFQPAIDSVLGLKFDLSE